MKKIMLGTSDAWWMSHLSQQPSEPAYYIVDCWISHLTHVSSTSMKHRHTTLNVQPWFLIQNSIWITTYFSTLFPLINHKINKIFHTVWLLKLIFCQSDLGQNERLSNTFKVTASLQNKLLKQAKKRVEKLQDKWLSHKPFSNF